MNAHILVVDDDDKLRSLLARYLKEQGIEVTACEDAASTKALLTQNINSINCAIIDVMMPGENGLELTQALKKNYPTLPILLLTARGEADDRINGLEHGADDYLVKPFEPRELLLRIQKLIQLYQHTPYTTQAKEENILLFGAYRFNLTNGNLHNVLEDELIHLTSTEIEILTLLAKAPNEAVSRETLAQQLNGISERSIDVQITRLRQKIEPSPKKPAYLQTVRNKGYILRIDSPQ